MKKLLIFLFSILFSLSAFSQIDNDVNIYGKDKNGRVIYEKIIKGASVLIEEVVVVDKDLYNVIDHQGVFNIGTQKNFNSFPFLKYTRQEEGKSAFYVTANYRFEGNKIIILAKNTVDGTSFALGIEYYIVVRYIRK